MYVKDDGIVDRGGARSREEREVKEKEKTISGRSTLCAVPNIEHLQSSTLPLQLR
jgi:hypothetical protein